MRAKRIAARDGVRAALARSDHPAGSARTTTEQPTKGKIGWTVTPTAFNLYLGRLSASWQRKQAPNIASVTRISPATRSDVRKATVSPVRAAKNSERSLSLTPGQRRYILDRR